MVRRMDMFIREETKSAWITTDGEAHLSMDDAIAHQRRLNLRQWADKVHLCRGDEWSEDMVIDAIIEHMDDFPDILLLDKYFKSE